MAEVIIVAVEILLCRVAGHPSAQRRIDQQTVGDDWIVLVWLVVIIMLRLALLLRVAMIIVLKAHLA